MIGHEDMVSRRWGNIENFIEILTWGARKSKKSWFSPSSRDHNIRMFFFSATFQGKVCFKLFRPFFRWLSVCAGLRQFRIASYCQETIVEVFPTFFINKNILCDSFSYYFRSRWGPRDFWGANRVKSIRKSRFRMDSQIFLWISSDLLLKSLWDLTSSENSKKNYRKECFYW